MKTIKGYIIRTIDYKETSKLLYVYTEHGIISMIARGVKKMNSPMRHVAQSGMLANFTITEGKLPTLKEAELINYYKHTKQDFDKHSIMHSLHDYIYYNTHDHDNHKKLFLFLEKVLSRLDESALTHELLLVFELKYLHFLGAGVNFKHCEQCQTTNDLVFDLSQSTVMCKKHASATHQLYDASLTNYLRTFYYCDVLTLDLTITHDYEVKVLYELTDALYQTHLGFNSKAKSILKTLL